MALMMNENKNDHEPNRLLPQKKISTNDNDPISVNYCMICSKNIPVNDPFYPPQFFNGKYDLLVTSHDDNCNYCKSHPRFCELCWKYRLNFTNHLREKKCIVCNFKIKESIVLDHYPIICLDCREDNRKYIDEKIIQKQQEIYTVLNSN
jgi:hypothetical protein